MHTTPAEQLHRAWDESLSGIDAPVGVQLRSAGRVVAERNSDEPHYAASTMKLAVLGALLRPGAALDLRDHLEVGDSFASAVGGRFVLNRVDDQDDLTWARLGGFEQIGTLAERMITLSSNLATDLLLTHLGFAAVNELLDAAGVGDSVVVGRLIGDTCAQAAGVTNTVTAAGLAQLLSGLTDGSLLAAGTEEAIRLLAGQTHRDMIPAGLPADAWSASKGGWVDGVNHDVALVRPPAAPDYVLAVCTSTGLSHDAGCALVAELSRITWEHWNRWHS